MRPPAAWKIGVAALGLTVLSWLPGGPGPGWGQVAAEPTVNPEIIVVRSVSFYSLTSASTISGNSLTEANSRYSLDLVNSFRAFTGIAQATQSAGALNNQTTVVGIAGMMNGELSAASVSHQSRISNNVLQTSNTAYQTAISGSSFSSGSGVAQVTQAAGNMNSQFNAFNVTVGAGLNVVTDTQLSAVRANNLLTSNAGAPNAYTTKLDLEGGAFNNFTGLASTSQIAGNMNQVSTVFNVNVITVP